MALVFLLASIMASAKRAVQKIERAGIVLAHGGPHAAVVLLDELNQEIFNLGFLRVIFQTRVADRLGPAHFVDPNHERLDVLERLVRLDDRAGPARRKRTADAQERDLQIGVHDGREP